MANISEEELRDEITNILKNASLDKTSTKKVIQKLEKKLGVDLSKKKKLIDQLVMDYVNSLESESGDEDEEEEEEVVVKKKKIDDEEEEEERDDSNDSDWGDELLNEFVPNVDYHYSPAHGQQESTITTSQMRPNLAPRSNVPRKAVILKRVAPTNIEEDESDIFGKLTAKKLRKLPEEKRDSLMIQINKLIYEKSYKSSTLKAHGRQAEISKPPRVAQPVPVPVPGLAGQVQARKIFRVKSLPGSLATFVSYDPSLLPLHPHPQAPVAPPAPAPNGAAPATPEDPGYVCNLM